MSSLPPASFDNVIAWENLLLAYQRAAVGRRRRAATASFEHQVADRLLDLQRALRERQYIPGRYQHFLIHDPKRRKISAAPFRDRVVHHALCQIIEPWFERTFIYDSYANRLGKGTHRAIDRLQQFSNRYRYVLRLDIVKHFPSINHAVLTEVLCGTLHDPGIRWLTAVVLASGAGALDDEEALPPCPGDSAGTGHHPRGLPIGNLTSQFWSNCYLNPLDHFIKRELRCRGYLRYVDDFALFSNEKQELWDWQAAVSERLATLRLRLHTNSQPVPVEHGIPWLGFIVFPSHRRLKGRKVRNFARRLRQRWAEHCKGKISFAEFDATVQGWVNHVSTAEPWGLRTKLFAEPFRMPETDDSM